MEIMADLDHRHFGQLDQAGRDEDRLRSRRRSEARGQKSKAGKVEAPKSQ